MRAFNLAEARIVERNYCQTHINRRLRIIGLLIVSALLVCIASFICKAVFAVETRQTKSKLAHAQELCVDSKQKMQILNTRIAERKWQAQLAAESGRWLDVFDSVTARVPNDVWLDSIKNSPAESKLTISGRAASFNSIVTFINTLRCANNFSDVQLESAKAASGEQMTSIDFTLELTLKDGAKQTSNAASANTPPDTSTDAAQQSTSTRDQAEPARARVPDVPGAGR